MGDPHPPFFNLIFDPNPFIVDPSPGAPMPSFQIPITINADLKTIYAHLARPENFIGLQPLLTSISPVREWTRADGKTVRSYQTVETFRWLGLPIYNNRINVDLAQTRPDEQLDAYVKSFPNLSLHAAYLFAPAPGGTLLTLTIDIEVAKILQKAVMAEALRVQKITLANLKSRMENKQ
jgi:hypothetical protein